MANIKGENAFEAWRKLSRRFDPQTPEVHGNNLRQIILYGEKHKASHNSEAQPAIDAFEKLLEQAVSVPGALLFPKQRRRWAFL